MSNIDYKVISGRESSGRYGTLGIKIMVGGDLPANLKAEKIDIAIWDAMEKIQSEIYAEKIKHEPEARIESISNRNEILSCFPDKIFVEEIPNGYCHQYCCRHLPWFIVTTEVGRFKIGWRKSVINIDWSETVGTANSEDLFVMEDVTKSGKMIHAWSVTKAKEYIGRIIGQAYT